MPKRIDTLLYISQGQCLLNIFVNKIILEHKCSERFSYKLNEFHKKQIVEQLK